MQDLNSGKVLRDEYQRKRIYFFAVSYVGVFFLILLGSFAFYEGNGLLGSLDFFIAITLTGLIIYTYKSGKISGPIDVGITGIAIFYMYLFATGGVNNSACLWYYTFPLISFFLLGIRKGLWSSLILLAFALFVFLLDSQFVLFTNYMLDFKLRFIPSYIVVVIFAYVYEIYRERSESVLHGKIAARTAELVKSNKHLANEIDERKKAEQNLKDSHQRLFTVLNSFDALVTVIDLNSYEILFANQCAKDAFGDITGKICWQAMHKGLSEPCSFCPNDKLIDISRKPTLPYTWELESDVTGRWYEHRDRAIEWYDNRIVKIQIATDITTRKQTEQELLKVKKLESVGLLAGGIAHDFNNILAAILGNINLVLYDQDLNEKTRYYLSEAEKASHRAKDITQHLLTFSKGGEPIKETSSLDNVIIDSAKFVLHGDKVACRFNIPDDLWLVDIDKGQISQVVQNIVLNASQAMPDGGIINIRCENYSANRDSHLPSGAFGKFVRIIIEDSGVGIPKQHLEKIFDPYFSTKQEGSGLGLAICQSIIGKHDGEIFVESAPAKGATFIIYLPASKRTEVQLQKDVEYTISPHSKILIMDDEELVRNVAESMLEALGHDVILTSDGNEAIQFYREMMGSNNPIDIVIMDLTIPGGMGGKQAVKEIKKLNPEARVIVASGYSKDPIMANYEQYGFCAAIAKPFQLEDVARAISCCLLE